MSAARSFGELDSDIRSQCCTCGVTFASEVVALRRKDGGTFYCPNGHQLTYGESEKDRLRKELERTKAALSRERNDNDWQRSQRQTTEKRLIAQRGVTTRFKNKLKRTHAGVCPECNRTFKQLAAHMHTKHPAVAL